jgi:hypothetical protein
MRFAIVPFHKSYRPFPEIHWRPFGSLYERLTLLEHCQLRNVEW